MYSHLHEVSLPAGFQVLNVPIWRISTFGRPIYHDSWLQKTRCSFSVICIFSDHRQVTTNHHQEGSKNILNSLQTDRERVVANIAPKLFLVRPNPKNVLVSDVMVGLFRFLRKCFWCLTRGGGWCAVSATYERAGAEAIETTNPTFIDSFTTGLAGD